MNAAVKAITASLVGLAMVGCSSNDYTKAEAEPTEEPTQEAVAYDESQVREHIGLDADGYITFNGVECEAAVIMTDKAMVDMYAEEGDTVATNPDGTAGVKNTSAEQATCQEFFTEALSTFPDGEPLRIESQTDETVEPDYPGVFAFGDTAVHDNGLEITVSGARDYHPSSSAHGAGRQNKAFTITVKNGMNTAYDPTLLFATMASGGKESEQIFDFEKNMMGAPMTKVLPGKSVSYDVAFAVADPSDMVMDLIPIMGEDSIIFQKGWTE